MKLILLFVVVTVVAFASSLAYRLGAFTDVEVEVTEAGPFKMVYKHHVGAYHKIITAIEEVEKWARANGQSCQISFGEYLDDPKSADEDRLNSNGGCIVNEDWSTGLPEGLAYREIPRRQFVVAKFSGAPSIGPYKVYPRARDAMQDARLVPDGPVIELYEILADSKLATTYLFPAK